MNPSSPTCPAALDALVAGATRRVFTGVGSRSTPLDVGGLMAAIACKLVRGGWILRSGGADGADLAFESGVTEGERAKHIYLPYPGFNGSASSRSQLRPACFEMARQVHPAWDRCTDFARKAHARNAFQVMGDDLQSPSDLLVCWTPDGAIDAATARNAGGTRTAIVLAAARGIPVFNLQRPDHRQAFAEWVGAEIMAEVRPWLRMSGKAMPPPRVPDTRAPEAPRSAGDRPGRGFPRFR